MGKKAFIAAIVILAFLISLVAGMQGVEVARANPWIGEPVPPSLQVPNKDLPLLTIQSPQNITYNENEVLLNFTVTEPESWYTTNVSCYISTVSYQIDGQSVTLYQIDQKYAPWYSYPNASNSSITRQFSVPVKDLVEGQHSLEINVTAFSIYSRTSVFLLFYEVYPLDVSKTVSFVIAENPSPSPTLTVSPIISPSSSPTQKPTIEPTRIIDPIRLEDSPNSLPTIIASVAVIVAVVAIGVLVYLEKCKK